MTKRLHIDSSATLARSRVIRLRKLQGAMNLQINDIAHRLAAPEEGAGTDRTPEQWTALWGVWETSDALLQAIVAELPSPVSRLRRPAATQP